MDKKGEKRVPELRFKGFTDDWEQRKLGEVATGFEYGLNAKATKYDGVNKYLRITDIDDSTRLFSQSDLTSPEKISDIHAKYLLDNGDILFARTGASVGKSYRYDITDGKVYFAGFLIRISINSKNDTEFIFQKTLTAEYNNFVKVTSMRSGQPGINAREYSKFQFQVPKLKEQRKIGAFFKYLDKTITLHQRKLENIKELKLSYLQRLIPKKGNNESLSKFTQFPNSWTKVKLKECFKERKERSGEGELLAVTINSGVLKADSLDRKDNSSKDKSNYKVVKIGDIAYNSMRMWQGASGLSEFEGIVSPAYTVLIPNESKVDALFISYLFKTENMIQKFQANSQGLTSDTWNLKFPMLKNISIILPPLNEQKHIGKFLEQVDKNISIYENKINKLLDIKKSYLSKMFV